MILYPLVLALSLALSGLLVYLNERHGLFRGDVFPNIGAKWLAYLWLTLLVLIFTLLVVISSKHADKIDLAQLTFWSLFHFHIVLVIFLFGWWALSGTPPISRFLNLQKQDFGQAVLLGFGVGTVGWAVTIGIALAIGYLLMSLGIVPKPSPLIPWMTKLAVWQKLALIASAAVVEEAFFRGWLQKRVGLVASTIVFALGHAGYGQPYMLIGVTLISIVLGYTFYRTRNLVPCIIAHGVFDAIQLFVLVPLALKFSGV